MTEAQIILAHSRESGIVAIASGERFAWAHTALAESGFQRDDEGVWHLPADGTQTTVVDLVTCAKRHRTRVHTSIRRFIGDAARDLARLLPGQWHASVEIYSHPAWQEDLVPWIWDSGELGRAVQTERIPYAALLTDAVQRTALLFIERPGRQLDYWSEPSRPRDWKGATAIPTPRAASSCRRLPGGLPRPSPAGTSPPTSRPSTPARRRPSPPCSGTSAASTTPGRP
ncbi:hypothetical protein [Streptomyces asoensis]|uniref:Uncharacterized protein n=1 Tax=Streptomyces asoensis TaxID=249586 RepID=A0ABQ3S8M8_9ACTN|nr:hypothetical protein [Streptomyces asoensis]GGQ83355.1 hypothetical protein GCM10010496_53710 [Streptomyces asoensis]GHI64466.1 hypothetical protein Saso_61160 [Streptomyces asoensis]